MLLNIDSVNQIAPGRYATQLHVFGHRDAGHRAFMYSYTPIGQKSCCAVHLVIQADSGDIYVRDFGLLDDGRWRDSDGNVARAVVELLPLEVRELEIDDVMDLNPIEVNA